MQTKIENLTVRFSILDTCYFSVFKENKDISDLIQFIVILISPINLFISFLINVKPLNSEFKKKKLTFTIHF